MYLILIGNTIDIKQSVICKSKKDIQHLLNTSCVIEGLDTETETLCFVGYLITDVDTQNFINLERVVFKGEFGEWEIVIKHIPKLLENNSIIFIDDNY